MPATCRRRTSTRARRHLNASVPARSGCLRSGRRRGRRERQGPSQARRSRRPATGTCLPVGAGRGRRGSRLRGASRSPHACRGGTPGPGAERLPTLPSPPGPTRPSRFARCPTSRRRRPFVLRTASGRAQPSLRAVTLGRRRPATVSPGPRRRRASASTAWSALRPAHRGRASRGAGHSQPATQQALLPWPPTDHPRHPARPGRSPPDQPNPATSAANPGMPAAERRSRTCQRVSRSRNPVPIASTTATISWG